MRKYKDLIFWVGMVVIILSTILARPLSSLDEIWNFNIARGISNGLVPYKDISMITTPLTSFVTAIFVKIFGKEMFVTRILASILSIVNLGLVYKIFKRLKVKKSIAYLAILGIVFTAINYFYLDYNFFALTLILTIILLELKYQNKNDIKSNIIIGIVAGLAFCTKQTVGAIACFFVLFGNLFFAKSKSDIFKILKQNLFRLLGIFIPVVIFAVYLLITKSFPDFINYAIKGISTFTNKKSYLELISQGNIATKILSVILPIALISSVALNVLLKVRKKEKSKLFILTVYSLTMYLLVYPIADNTHFYIANIPTIILTVYLVCKAVKYLMQKNETVNKFLKKYKEQISLFAELAICALVVVLSVNTEYKNMEVMSNLSKYKNINGFKYIYVDESLQNLIKQTDNYIESKEQNVYILDSNAASYMIPINRYNKNYDMFALGNFGAGGEDSIIEKIKQEDAMYLVLSKDYVPNWQVPKNVCEYVRNNLQYVEKVGIYDVFKSTENKNAQEESTNQQTDSTKDENKEQGNENTNEQNVQENQ